MADAKDLPATPTSIHNKSTIRKTSSIDSLQKTPPPSHAQLARPLPVIPPPGVTLQDAPASPVSISPPNPYIIEPETASLRNVSGAHPSTIDQTTSSIESLTLQPSPNVGQVRIVADQGHSRASSLSIQHDQDEQPAQFQYHGFEDLKKKGTKQRASHMTMHSVASSGSSGSERPVSQHYLTPGPRIPSQTLQRPASTYTLGTEYRGRTLSPLSANGSDPGSPGLYARDLSRSRNSPLARPQSYVDLLNNVPYNQQIAPTPALNNAGLQSVVGNAASLLDTKKTLDMYRANVKKTQDAAVQYEFAIFMVNTAKDVSPGDGMDPVELVQEGKHILQRLSDRAYPFAQYYLADGYFSGLFNKDKPDYDRAFPLFVAASKHGHAESAYRAALCYEFGWGTAKAYPKAVQFYRASASKNHPGAATRLGLACLKGDMGLGKHSQKEGIRWLKRAQESADFQYNSAPYELGLMHLTGFSDEVFKDEVYAAQLLTQAAELGHPQANLMMGQAYENGLYGCPRDAALSVHFYNGAATLGVAEAMMALCAWYMVGAEPVLEKDEGEAYAWAKQAAELALPKAEYAVGYFTEMGIGCRRDPLEANVWYVRAADQGNDMAKQRLQIIRAAASGEVGVPMDKAQPKSKDLAGPGKDKKKLLGIF
ncbi:hypothetical protein AMS68_001903 [Peltaster fructicola]|uniref:HCP-like protein n=1 Tax=Peltaster fructicola TaxID=286661 RepID=A0A6H0XNX7_9PEZI|nr:hypothetical protein AMS68_001903 [Peltaster fructicola]